MKKYIIFILTVICLTLTKVNATNVRISSVELESKSDDVIINNEATFADLQVNTDVHFYTLNDYVKYKITLTNEDDEDYTIEATNDEDSEYIEYIYENADNIKANSTTTIYMTIKYTKLVEDAKYIDYKYSEEKSELLTLKNTKGEVVKVENPNTGNKIILIAIVISAGSLLTIILLRNKVLFRYSLIVIITGIISIPIICLALNSIELSVHSRVELDYLNDTFCINIYRYVRDNEDNIKEVYKPKVVKYLSYRKNMTIEEYSNYIMNQGAQDEGFSVGTFLRENESHECGNYNLEFFDYSLDYSSEYIYLIILNNLKETMTTVSETETCSTYKVGDITNYYNFINNKCSYISEDGNEVIMSSENGCYNSYDAIC